MALHFLTTGVSFADYSSNAGMTAELLDDFEEGTWTPTCSSHAFNSISYATYLKIAAAVYTTCHNRWDGAGSGNTAIAGGGLPYATTPEQYNSYPIDTNANTLSNLANIHIRHNSNGTTWGAYYGNDVGIVNSAWNASNGHFMWNGWCYTSS